MGKSLHIAFFISSHGLGHAARAAATMAAIHQRCPHIHFDIFTTVPEWFFIDSLSGPFSLHPVLTDIGLVQTDPFTEDVSRSLARLDQFFPFDSRRLAPILKTVSDSDCRMILCDIAPMGIEAGRRLKIPSVLIENFTWDWIYTAYLHENRQIKRHIDYLDRLFRAADYHIQTTPVCCPKPVDLTVGPISRKPRTGSRKVRAGLGVPETTPLIMITIGGIPQAFSILDTLRDHPEYTFVISGGGEDVLREGHIILLPYRSDYYHPDLIHAADIVVGKSGYSTLAEVYYRGVPFIFVTRPTFRESDIFTPHIQKHMNGLGISEEAFSAGSWLPSVPELLALPVIKRKDRHGGDEAAAFILKLLDR